MGKIAVTIDDADELAALTATVNEWNTDGEYGYTVSEVGDQLIIDTGDASPASVLDDLFVDEILNDGHDTEITDDANDEEGEGVAAEPGETANGDAGDIPEPAEKFEDLPKDDAGVVSDTVEDLSDVKPAVEE